MNLHRLKKLSHCKQQDQDPGKEHEGEELEFKHLYGGEAVFWAQLGRQENNRIIQGGKDLQDH